MGRRQPFRRMYFDMSFFRHTHRPQLVHRVSQPLSASRASVLRQRLAHDRSRPASKPHGELVASIPARPQVNTQPILEFRDRDQVRPLLPVEDPDDHGMFQAAHLRDFADASIADHGPHVDRKLPRHARGLDEALIERFPRHPPPLRLSDPRGRRLRPVVDKLTRSLTRRSGHTTSVDDSCNESRATRIRCTVAKHLLVVLSITITYRLTGMQIAIARHMAFRITGDAGNPTSTPQTFGHEVGQSCGPWTPTEFLAA